MKRRAKKIYPPKSLAEQVALLEQSEAAWKRSLARAEEVAWYWHKVHIEERIEQARINNPELYALLQTVIE